MKTFKFAAAYAFALTIMLFISGCDRSVDPHDHGHHSMEELRVIDRTQTARPVIAVWTHDEGWDREVLYDLSKSAEENRTRVSLGFQVLNDHGEEIEICRECDYGVRYWPATGANEGIIDISLDENLLFHGDHVHIYGLNTGETAIEFILWHGDHADASTTPILFRVTE